MFKGYKIHQEQIENVARTLKDSAQRMRPDPLKAGHAGKRKPALNSGITGSKARSRTVVWGTGEVKGAVTDAETDTFPGGDALRLRGPVIWCRKCSEGFPVLDFLYTQKTGLCISCWETKEE